MTVHKTATARHIDAGDGHAHGGIEIPTIPFSVMVDVARMGAQMGVGFAAMAFDQAQKLVWLAIDRGAKIEKQALKDLKHFEHEQVTYMKDYLKKVPGVTEKKGPTVEVQMEKALETFDVPTRDDIRGLEEKIDTLTHAVKARRRT